MLSILSLLAIFTFIIILFVASLKIIDLILATKIKFKPLYLKKFFTATSLFLWFCFGLVSIVIVSSLLVKLPLAFRVNSSETTNIILGERDCQELLNRIYAQENQIYLIENHRYLEESSSLFTIKLEYQQAGERLNTVAEHYLNSDLTDKGRFYGNRIAQLLQTKAQLFEERANFQENGKNIKKIADILKQMDRVTEQRKGIISAVKKQCNR